MRLLVCFAAMILIGCGDHTPTPPATESVADPFGFEMATMNDLPLVYSTGFEEGTMEDWHPATAEGWRIDQEGENNVLNQFVRETDFEPPVRSPFNRAVLETVEVGSFVLQARVKSTVEEYGHRDVVVLFGYQDETHFYYAHFGKTADDQAHTIHIVNDAPRISIATDRTDGTPWTENWHVVRVVRDTDTGSIAAYFDNMETPVMVATDTTFGVGKVGLGTFDDTAMFDDVRIWGE